jgi:YgiT-type zinc finger domain-containing protein
MGGGFPAEEAMKCVICKAGETRPGKTAVTLERGRMTLVFKGVPAEVCENCGEAYISAQLGRQLLASAENAAQSGVEVDVREFVAIPA